MPPDLLLGADFGSSGLKAALFDPGLHPVATAHASYQTHRSAGNLAEQNPDELWQAFRHVCAELLADADAAARVAGIGISSHYPSLLPLDAAGDYLLPAQTWMDERGAPYCQTVEAALSRVGHGVNGNPVEGFHPLPKAMWLQEHRPDVLKRTVTFAQLHSFIAAQLTGQPVCADRTTASWFHNFDIWNDTWSHDVTTTLGLEPSHFPPVRAAWDVVGEVSAAAARLCRLAPGTPVVVGTGDAVAAALGAGVGAPGQAYLTTGTGGCVCVVTAEPRFRQGLVTESFAPAGTWLIEGIVKNIGVLLQWFLRELGSAEVERARTEGISPFSVLEKSAAQAEPLSGGLLCLPYFSGEQSPIQLPDARGVIFGLTLETTRSDILRALMEGVAYAVAHNLETIGTRASAVTELRITGGPASSDLWAQIIADVTGVEIVRPAVPESAPLGSAMLAAIGVGRVSGLEEARQAVRIERRFRPDEHTVHRYTTGYERYRFLVERTLPLFPPVGDS